MDKRRGTLYGVSVGPGDPELITIKTQKTLEQCSVLAVPETHGCRSLALDIASKALDVSRKTLLPLPFLMTTDPEALRQNYAVQAARVAQVLTNGEDVAFICLGDVSVFSTFSYIGEILTKQGFRVVMIPGVTSFCASACALGISLAAAGQPLHVIPAGYGGMEDALCLPGVKVLLKSAGQFSEVRRAVMTRGQSACAVVNCGLDGEKLYDNLNDIPEDPGYFTTVIVREQP